MHRITRLDSLYTKAEDSFDAVIIVSSGGNDEHELGSQSRFPRISKRVYKICADPREFSVLLARLTRRGRFTVYMFRWFYRSA